MTFLLISNYKICWEQTGVVSETKKILVFHEFTLRVPVHRVVERNLAGSVTGMSELGVGVNARHQSSPSLLRFATLPTLWNDPTCAALDM